MFRYYIVHLKDKGHAYDPVHKQHMLPTDSLFHLANSTKYKGRSSFSLQHFCGFVKEIVDSYLIRTNDLTFVTSFYEHRVTRVISITRER